MPPRIPQIRMIKEDSTHHDLIYGSAKVMTTTFRGVKGWCLPGGKFTKSKEKAEIACKKIHHLIQCLSGDKAVNESRAKQL